MKQKLLFFMSILIFLAIVLPVPVLADIEEPGDIEFLGLELEKLLYFGSGILAIILFVITIFAYQRTQRSRLKYVSIAFLIFAIKGFLLSSELFFEEIAWLDPTVSVLNFLILLILFFGLIKK